ncbi:MAG TPA: hypothetical protein VGC06_21880, partial [Actinomycetes bacterium]
MPTQRRSGASCRWNSEVATRPARGPSEPYSTPSSSSTGPWVVTTVAASRSAEVSGPAREWSWT